MAVAKTYYFDESAADRPVGFCRDVLRHTKGVHAGQPFELLPWQSDLIREVFGWKVQQGARKAKSDPRKYRRVYVEIPRKNGKSQIAAAIALYLLFSDGEPSAEVYSAAADTDQAALVFDAAKDMMEESPQLVTRGETYRRNIIVTSTKSKYRVLSAETKTKHGLNASGIIFDELHTQPNRDLWDVLTTSVGARRQPLIFAITTAGFDRHSICWEIHEYALNVRNGVIDDPEFLPIIYAAPDDADWTDSDVWTAANPSIDVTVSSDYLAAECRRAQETPGYVNTFRRLHLNQWTESSSRWLDMAAWDECGEVIDPKELRGQTCWGGLDLSTTTDLSAFVLVFERGAGYAVLAYFWVPEESIRQRARRDRVPYDVWERDGYMEATAGNVVDYHQIHAVIRDLSEVYRIQEIGYDPWNATGLVSDLMEDGATMVPVRQGYASLTGPSKELEKLVTSRALHHGGHPVLRWCAANVVIETDPAGNIKPSKSKSTERIDGIAALVIALGRAIVGDTGDSVYEERGLLTL